MELSVALPKIAIATQKAQVFENCFSFFRIRNDVINMKFDTNIFCG
jgi:hypothetical protein